MMGKSSWYLLQGEGVKTGSALIERLMNEHPGAGRLKAFAGKPVRKSCVKGFKWV